MRASLVSWELPFMSPRPDLGPKPRLGYAASRIDRAATRRTDALALVALEQSADARAYAIAGELVILRKTPTGSDPLFFPAAARELGAAAEIAFLGLHDGEPRFAVALAPAVGEALRSDERFIVSDLRSIAVRGLVEAEHLPPLAEGKALLSWHARHRFCPNCGAATNPVDGGWRR